MPYRLTSPRNVEPLRSDCAQCPGQTVEGGRTFSHRLELMKQQLGQGGHRVKLWRVGMDGKNSRRLTSGETRSPRISPDGRVIACYISDPNGGGMKLALISPDTGQVIKALEIPEHDDVPFLDWSRDGQSLFVVLSEESLPAYGRFLSAAEPRNSCASGKTMLSFASRSPEMDNGSFTR